MRRSRSIKPRRLREIGRALKVPLADGQRAARSPAFVSEFLATDDGVALFRAFMRLPDGRLRRDIVPLIIEIADNSLSTVAMRLGGVAAVVIADFEAAGTAPPITSDNCHSQRQTKKAGRA